MPKAKITVQPWKNKESGFEYVQVDGKTYILLENMLSELEKIRKIFKI